MNTLCRMRWQYTLHSWRWDQNKGCTFSYEGSILNCKINIEMNYSIGRFHNLHPDKPHRNLLTDNILLHIGNNCSHHTIYNLNIHFSKSGRYSTKGSILLCSLCKLNSNCKLYSQYHHYSYYIGHCAGSSLHGILHMCWQMSIFGIHRWCWNRGSKIPDLNSNGIHKACTVKRSNNLHTLLRLKNTGCMLLLTSSSLKYIFCKLFCHHKGCIPSFHPHKEGSLR